MRLKENLVITETVMMPIYEDEVNVSILFDPCMKTFPINPNIDSWKAQQHMIFPQDIYSKCTSNGFVKKIDLITGDSIIIIY